MANTRTFLAWLRTSVTLIALGFVVARFGLFLRALPATAGSAGAGPVGISAFVGVALVLAGVVLTVLAVERFLTARRRIDEGAFVVNVRLEMFAGIAVFAAGLALAAYLVLTR
ncbi:MAG: DUF202 domain-containing protein [Chloroflexota bacterium]|nr:DUF202 domain-containing protein [Chloroflexota bacterium]